MTRNLANLVLVGIAGAWPMLAAAEKAAKPTSQDYTVRFVIVFLIAVLITIFLVPTFYRRAKAKQGGDKNLSRFLLLDPNTRDMILEQRGVKEPDSQADDQDSEDG